MTTIGILFAGTGAVYASDDAVPGQLLFGVDLATESVVRTFTTDPVAKAELELEVMEERVNELLVLSDDNSSTNISTAIDAITEQQTRIETSLQTMTKLRTENKLQSEEQLKVMEKLKTMSQAQVSVMNQVQDKLDAKGQSAESAKLDEAKAKYQNDSGSQEQNFESSTGLQVNEAENEQNKGEDTQIQNQNQNETNNQGEISGSENGNGGSTTTPQQQGR